MIDRRLLEVAAARGMAATAVQTEARTSQVSFEFNRLKGLEDTEELSTVLQVIRDGKLGLAGSTRPDGMTDLVDAAAEVAEFGAPVTYELPAPAPAARLAAHDPRLAALTVDEMIGYGERITSFLRRLHPDLQVMVIMEREAQHRAISNTAGLQAAWDRTTFEMYVGAEMIRGKDFLAISDGIATTTADFDLAALLQGLAEDFTAAQQVVSLEQGNYPVLFRPAAFSELISPLLACLDGGAVVRGVSPLGGRLGEAILAPSLTVVEDGILDGGYGSRMYDDQGVACRRTPLIEAGVLREFLLDLDSAARLGRRPIGTGGMTRPRPNNILVLPGDTSWRAMVAGIRRGIMIAQSIGAWAGNPYSGQVSGSIGLGYLIEDGQIQGRIKDCMFNLNVFTHLRTHLQALSSETKVLGGQVLPWALIDGVSLATRGS
jgi:PmbA protein